MVLSSTRAATFPLNTRTARVGLVLTALTQ
jgi:hypothetical protein